MKDAKAPRRRATFAPFDYLRHILCIAALMWTALVNGQAFFFPDTTSYVRAADIAVYLASDHHIATAWTSRYAQALVPKTGQPAVQATSAPHYGNDISSGLIMSGRSPYIGAALYLGYVTSNFWLFVIFQAALAYWLIRLALRRFGIIDESLITGIVIAIAATTSLPYFNALLLADAFASFGILAFLLIATDDGTLRRGEVVGLALITAFSATAHLTHILMLLGMTVMLALLQAARLAPRNRRALAVGAGCVLIGLLSASLTTFVTTSVFKKPPQLVPLMTARFIQDGPGADYIRSGCPGHDFAVCHIHAEAMSSQGFLWSRNAHTKSFLTVAPDLRQRISKEDVAFAIAVWKAYPVRETGLMIRNSVAQMLTFPYAGLNTGCWTTPGCWDSLPQSTRDTLRRSLSGRNLWPASAMTDILYAAVALSLLAIAVMLPRLMRSAPALGRTMALWLALAFVAMAVCDILGGAVSDPQYRYQGRLIWLIALFAATTVMAAMRSRTPDDHQTGIRAKAS